MEMEHAHPTEISIRGFDESHLLPLSTNRFYRLNGKQPRTKSNQSVHSTTKLLDSVSMSAVLPIQIVHRRSTYFSKL